MRLPCPLPLKGNVVDLSVCVYKRGVAPTPFIEQYFACFMEGRSPGTICQGCRHYVARSYTRFFYKRCRHYVAKTLKSTTLPFRGRGQGRRI